jgi:very-short-patch-repair endonuclease
MDKRLSDLAIGQGGVIRRRQAFDLGLSGEELTALIQSEELTRICPGRYRVHPAESWADRVRGLRVLAGRDAIACRGTAARLHGIEGPPTSELITFYVPASAHLVRRPGMWVTRSEFAPTEICVHDDVPCTATLRTVVDCARFLPHANAVATIEGGVRKGLALDEVRVEIGALGRVVGAPAARRALRRVDLRSQSLLETEARLLLLDSGVDVEPQVELGNWHADLGVLGVRLAIELQGGTHRTKEQQQEDETKRAAFIASGWELVGFTADDVRKRPGYLVALVRRLVAVRANDSSDRGSFRTP